MVYHSRFRRWLNDSLLEGKVIFAVYIFLIVIFFIYPDLAVFISNYLGSLPLPGIGLLSGPTSLLIIPILGIISYVIFVYLLVRILWAMDTSMFEDKLNQDVSKIAELLGHSSYVELKSTFELKNFRKVLGTLPNSRPRWAWIRRALLSMFVSEDTPIGLLRKHYGISIWKLIFLINYIRVIETRMRQSTQAPTSILEYPMQIAENDLPLPKGIDSPFTPDELEIISFRIDKEKSFCFRRRVQHSLKNTWISPIVLLEKGIVTRDYVNGNVQKFVSTLTSLIESHKDEENDITLPPMVSRESIASIVRSTDKQYDFKVEKVVEIKKVADKWVLEWCEEKSRNALVTDDHRVSKIYELPGIKDFKFNLYTTEKPDPALAPTVLDIEGYLVHRYGDSKNIQVHDNVDTVESLNRIQRLLLDDIFEDAIDGNILIIKDPSNLRMILEAFINRQKAIEMAEQPDSLSNPKHISTILLRLNALGQSSAMLSPFAPDESLFRKIRLDMIQGSQTLATSGLLGLDYVNDDAKKKIEEYVTSKTEPSITIDGMHPGIRKSSYKVHVPQLGQDEDEHILSGTRRTEDVTEANALVWAATGAGAWIIERNHMSYFTQPIPQDAERGLLLIHHPLREQVFLETLTHRNYHYVWEILRNRVRFQEMCSFIEADTESNTNIEFVWVRESFLPSGNSFLLNEESKQVLDKVSKVCDSDKKNTSDYCVMLTRSNHLIRGPVNGLNMIFAENIDSLSPLPAMTFDIVLRQRMFEQVARCFSKGEGLIDGNGNPTPLVFAVNWLKPYQEKEPDDGRTIFSDHSFADPATWNNLGFLDILVKETKCAYALVKVLFSYRSMLKNGDRLPFRLVHTQEDESKRQDIDHLTSSYDMLCDFLTGQGDFSKSNVYAIGEDKGYLHWLRKTLQQLPSIGMALGNQEFFKSCIAECTKWLGRMNSFLGDSMDPLKLLLEEILTELRDT